MENLKVLLDSLVDISEVCSSSAGDKSLILAKNTEFIKRKITRSLETQARPEKEILEYLLKTFVRLTKIYSSNKESNHMIRYSIDFLKRKISSEIALIERYKPLE